MSQQNLNREIPNEELEGAHKQKKRLSLKQKAFQKKAKQAVEAEQQHQKEQSSSDNKFYHDKNSIFDTKKGQVLFELQKSYKGDQRFKLDKRFAEDVDAQMIPKSLKQLTVGIDFQNLSDGSDYDFKKESHKQKKSKKLHEKEEKKTNKLKTASKDNENESENDEQNKTGFEPPKVDDESDSDFFTIKVDNSLENQKRKKSDDVEHKSQKSNLTKRKSEKEVQESLLSSDEEEEKEEDDDKESSDKSNQSNEEEDENRVNNVSNDMIKYDSDDLQDDDGGSAYRKFVKVAKDYIDQEALLDEDDIQDLTLEEEQHCYLKILQELMPDEKLFFQNKKKNVKIVNNSFAGYASMLTEQESSMVAGKKSNKDKKKQKEEEGNNEGEADENNNRNAKKTGFDKFFNDNDDAFGVQKSEKAYNLVIPRFDPSQLVVKKVMQAQEREKLEKLKEQESKKKKKQSIEAKIESGIDKKLQNIMKANSILDKNLTEHKKLEGVEQVKKKAPELKKLKIDSDKWRNIIMESSGIQNNSVTQTTEADQSAQSLANKSSGQNKGQQERKPIQQHRQPSSQFSSSLGMLFATIPSSNTIDPSKSQFKLFG